MLRGLISVIAEGPTDLLVIDRDSYNTIVRNRREAENKERAQWLKDHVASGAFEQEEIKKLARVVAVHLEAKKLTAGTILVRQNQVPDGVSQLKVLWSSCMYATNTNW